MNKKGKNMKNKWIILAGAVALTAFSTVQATPITGQIDMAGSVQLNNTFLGSATATLGFGAVTVGVGLGDATGSFGGTQGATVTWHNFSFPGGPVNPLWNFTFGTRIYTFNLSSDTVSLQNNTHLNLDGTGTLTITDLALNNLFDPTTGAWSFSINQAGGGASPNFDFTFSNSQVAAVPAVPDGGMTVILLGAALSGLGLLRKKLIA